MPPKWFNVKLPAREGLILNYLVSKTRTGRKWFNVKLSPHRTPKCTKSPSLLTWGNPTLSH